MSDSRPYHYSCRAVINERMHIKQLLPVTRSQRSCLEASPSYPQATLGKVVVVALTGGWSQLLGFFLWGFYREG